MTRLPANYQYSTWVLKSNNPGPKIKYNTDGPVIWDSLPNLKVAKPTMSVVHTAEFAYGNYMTQTKAHIQSFNYTRADQLKIDNNIVLDLHDESNTLEKLDKLYDIRDGYAI